jgi:hypothetical protein
LSLSLYRRTLGTAANFCLTALEHYSGGDRSAAAGRYSISKPVLNKLADLAAEKGGDEARKAGGANTPFTDAERRWLEEAMKRLILRAGEVATNPSTQLPQITMKDLPSLEGS